MNMHSHFLLITLIGVVFAAPRPQDINLDAIDAAPGPVMVTPALDVSLQVATVAPVAAQFSAAAAISTAPAVVAKRDKSYINLTQRSPLRARNSTCAKQPAGLGPVADPDTPEAFISNPEVWEMANSVSIPEGYAESFFNLSGTTIASNYLGLFTVMEYDTLGCGAMCDQTSNCVSFNIFIERDPTLDPDPVNCPNPPSTTNFKCTLWGVPITPETATNTGGYLASFQVRVSSSNGYNKVSPPSRIANYTGPVEFGGAINAPLDSDGQDTYLGYRYYPFSQDQGYTPATCFAACTSQTAYNKANPASDGTYQTCEFWNSYVLSKNGIPQGLYCSLYSQIWDQSYATNYGQYRGSDNYTVSYSYGYGISDPCTINQDSWFDLLDSNGNYFDQRYNDSKIYYQSSQPTHYYRIDNDGHLVSSSTDMLCTEEYGTLPSFVQPGNCTNNPICRLAEDDSLDCTFGDGETPFYFAEVDGYVREYAFEEDNDGNSGVSVKAVPVHGQCSRIS